MFTKKGQNWSLEVIVALSFFVVIFVAMASLLVFEDSDSLSDVQLASDVAASRLFVSGDASVSESAIVVNNIVQNEKLEQLYATPYNDLQEDLGIDDDFCIIITDSNGNILQVQPGENGVGSANIQVDGVSCSQI